MIECLSDSEIHNFFLENEKGRIAEVALIIAGLVGTTIAILAILAASDPSFPVRAFEWMDLAAGVALLSVFSIMTIVMTALCIQNSRNLHKRQEQFSTVLGAVSTALGTPHFTGLVQNVQRGNKETLFKEMLDIADRYGGSIEDRDLLHMYEKRTDHKAGYPSLY